MAKVIRVRGGKRQRRRYSNLENRKTGKEDDRFGSDRDRTDDVQAKGLGQFSLGQRLGCGGRNRASPEAGQKWAALSGLETVTAKTQGVVLGYHVPPRRGLTSELGIRFLIGTRLPKLVGWIVAQIFNLLYRRVALGGAPIRPERWTIWSVFGLQIRDTAE